MPAKNKSGTVSYLLISGILKLIVSFHYIARIVQRKVEEQKIVVLTKKALEKHFHLTKSKIYTFMPNI